MTRLKNYLRIVKKQDLIKPKKDKKLDADDSLGDVKKQGHVAHRKPSNKKLSSEKHLSSGNKVKKVNEILSFDNFSINEELTKLPTTYKFHDEKADKAHDRLAGKKKDGHSWTGV